MLALAATGPVSRWFTLFHQISVVFVYFLLVYLVGGFKDLLFSITKRGCHPVTQWLDVLLRSWRQVADSGNWPWRGSRTGDGRSYSDGVAGSQWFQSVPTTANIIYIL